MLFEYYHAHVYFTAETVDHAVQLHGQLSKDFANEIAVKEAYLGRLIHRAIGPHPTPMFEFDFGKKLYPTVIRFLELNRGSSSVLIHPVTGDDLADHTHLAQWLGGPLPLNLKILEP